MKVLKFECLNRVRSFVFIALIFVFSLKSYGLNFYQIQGSMRSFPQSGSIEGRYYFNEKLWSQESEGAPWKYGFWRVGAMAAAHGLAGVSIEVSPISLWQIILQNSVTSRFYDTKTVDCKMFECRGWITRGTLKTSFLLGRTFNTLGLFFIPSLFDT